MCALGLHATGKILTNLMLAQSHPQENTTSTFTKHFGINLLPYEPTGPKVSTRRSTRISAKLVKSVNAFSQLLNVSSPSVIDCPTVLVSNIHAELEDQYNSFILATQESIYDQVL